MIKIISYISFAFAALFLLLLIGMLLQNVKKKSLKNRTLHRSRSRLYGVAAAIFLVAGLVLYLMPQKSADLKQFINETSPAEVYQKTEADEALPTRVFAVGDDYYLLTGRGELYGHLAFTKEKKTVYKNGLCYEKASAIAGGKDLLAVLGQKGSLRLSGAFEYQAYEQDDTLFSSTLYAKDCSFIAANNNNLMYVSGGDLYSAGYNTFGQLGDGTERSRTESAMILENVASVSVSDTHTLAVDAFGNLYGFGDNSYSEMGNRTTAASGTPIKLMSGVKQALAGRYFSVVLAKNGDVYTAGRNDLGQLGTGDTRDSATYVKVLSGIMKIAVGESSCAALTADGTLYVWGDNAEGQLGKGDASVLKPQKIAKDVYDVAMGTHSMGLIRLDRDFAVSGAARPEKNEDVLQSVYILNADVSEELRYQETVEMPKEED